MLILIYTYLLMTSITPKHGVEQKKDIFLRIKLQCDQLGFFLRKKKLKRTTINS